MVFSGFLQADAGAIHIIAAKPFLVIPKWVRSNICRVLVSSHSRLRTWVCFKLFFVIARRAAPQPSVACSHCGRDRTVRGGSLVVDIVSFEVEHLVVVLLLLLLVLLVLLLVLVVLLNIVPWIIKFVHHNRKGVP